MQQSITLHSWRFSSTHTLHTELKSALTPRRKNLSWWWWQILTSCAPSWLRL